MNKYTRLYLNYTKCGPFFNDYMGEFLVSIYRLCLLRHFLQYKEIVLKDSERDK